MTQAARNAAATARNTPRTPRQKPAVGTRVSHPTRGIGSVTEHMEDGRVRVKFDDGDALIAIDARADERGMLC